MNKGGTDSIAEGAVEVISALRNLSDELAPLEEADKAEFLVAVYKDMGINLAFDAVEGSPLEQLAIKAKGVDYAVVDEERGEYVLRISSADFRIRSITIPMSWFDFALVATDELHQEGMLPMPRPKFELLRTHGSARESLHGPSRPSLHVIPASHPAGWGIGR